MNQSVNDKAVCRTRSRGLLDKSREKVKCTGGASFNSSMTVHFMYRQAQLIGTGVESQSPKKRFQGTHNFPD